MQPHSVGTIKAFIYGRNGTTVINETLIISSASFLTFFITHHYADHYLVKAFFVFSFILPFHCGNRKRHSEKRDKLKLIFPLNASSYILICFEEKYCVSTSKKLYAIK